MTEYFQNRSGIFDNERVLNESYTPDDLPERENELTQLGHALSPALNGAPPKNAFLTGKTGQGKTAASRFILNQFRERAEEVDDLDLTTIFQTCAGHSSSYQLACDLVEQQTGQNPNGHPKRKVFDQLYEALQKIGGTVILVLDEVDNIGDDDLLLYELPRARDNGHIKDMDVSVIGISNDASFTDNLSPKVKDSLCEENIEFSPYDANQLRPILERRAEKAFVDGTVSDSAIRLCAAYAAQDKGSARQAINYLYKAGELAVEHDDDQVIEEHVQEAEEIVERKNITQSIRNLTIQDHLALLAIVSIETDGETPVRTRNVYSVYTDIANAVGADTLAMRRVRNHLQELDMIGVINGAKRTGGSRGGQHYYWELDTDLQMTVDVLSEIDRLNDIVDQVY